MPPRKPSPIGAHVFTAGGLATTGLAYARRIRAAVMQVFVTNPRGWAPSPGDPRQDEGPFRGATRQANLSLSEFSRLDLGIERTVLADRYGQRTPFGFGG